MFSVGDTIQYSSTGICKIINIEQKTIGNIIKDYFVLKPISNSKSTIFVPTDCKRLTDKMRKLLSKQEILDIISSSQSSPNIWINDDIERRKAFNDILNSGDRKNILILIRSLYLHKTSQQSLGRKFHISDEKIFKDAERILYDELSYVLEIQSEEVSSFIENHLNK